MIVLLDKYANAIVGLALVVVGVVLADANLQEVIVGGGLGVIGAPVLSRVRA